MDSEKAGIIELPDGCSGLGQRSHHRSSAWLVVALSREWGAGSDFSVLIFPLELMLLHAHDAQNDII